MVGYYVGKSWNLPRYLCEAIHEHHRAEVTLTEENAEPKKKTLLAILKMSEHICGTYKILGYQDVDHEWDRIGDSILMYVGMSKYDFETMVAQIGELGLGNREYCSL